jgi:hypothetical protein
MKQRGKLDEELRIVLATRPLTAHQPLDSLDKMLDVAVKKHLKRPRKDDEPATPVQVCFDTGLRFSDCRFLNSTCVL